MNSREAFRSGDRQLFNACPLKTALKISVALSFCLMLFPAFYPKAFGASREIQNEDCFACHNDDTLNTERDGEKVSLFVDQNKFAISVHGSLTCVTCHKDLATSEFPHAVPLAHVDCGACHAGEQKLFADSLHGQALERGDKLAPRCSNCHGNHEILPLKDKNSNLAPLRIPFVCGSCHSEGGKVQRQRNIHQDHVLENYSESIHGEGLFKKGLSVSATCASCHSAHQILPHTDPRSTIARENVVETCLKCHSQIEAVHRKVIKGELWEKKPESIPVCVECHQPHKVRKVFYDQGVADKDCLMCHAKPELKSSSDGRSLFVDAGELQGSMHSKLSCAQCHNEVSPSKLRACETIKAKVNCAVCHGPQVEQYQKSTHGRVHQKGSSDAPVCADCHGTHRVLGKKDPDSPSYPINVPKLCAGCHQINKKAAVRYKGTQKEITEHYMESIHGKGLLKGGLVVTAMCTSCHTAHHELPSSDPESSVHRNNIAVTCANCHKGVYEKFETSVHAPGKGKEPEKLPVCNDCHSAHTIKRTDMDTFKFGIMSICGKCHLDIAKTYFDTFHGKVTRLGYDKTAKCQDCHGAHDILRTSDPNSKLSRRNIISTCQKCHPGATRKFAGYLTHATHHDPKKYPLVFWTFWLMTGLLVGTFTAFGIHTLLWLPRSLERRRAHTAKPEDPNEKQYVRFSLLNRILHASMIVSFLILATTGMILKFSYTGWANFLSHLFGGVEVTGFFHRAAAVLLIGIFGVHLWDLCFRKKKEMGGWKKMLLGPDTMLPTFKDVREVIATLKWYFGKGERPDYGRWTYWEKFDYFAVFWGIAIIGSSGLMLWFPEFFTRFLPGWLINVATIIHSDEALLAAGFIFTIHFFNTHFRPEKFPMDTVIFSGRISVEELKRDKPAEYEALMAKHELEKHLEAPLSSNIKRAITIFGWTALGIGMSLIVGIIYAMLFTYK